MKCRSYVLRSFVYCTVLELLYTESDESGLNNFFVLLPCNRLLALAGLLIKLNSHKPRGKGPNVKGKKPCTYRAHFVYKRIIKGVNENVCWKVKRLTVRSYSSRETVKSYKQ